MDKMFKEQLQAQKAAQTLAFKQECRRTAMQLAERLSDKTIDDVDATLKHADKIYNWLIAVK